MIDQQILNRAKKRGQRAGLRTKAPKWKYPGALERQYKSMLRGMLQSFKELLRQELIPAIEMARKERGILAPRSDGWSDTLTRAVSSATFKMQNVADKVGSNMMQLATYISAFNKSQLTAIMRTTLGVDIIKQEPWLADELRSWANENVKLIKSIPDQSLASIETLAQKGVRSGASAADIASEIMKQYGKTESRAMLIARDQVATLNGQLTQARQQDIGVNKYIWRTSRDERVRESHKVMAGKLCRWDDDSVYSDDKGKTWKKRSSIGGYVGVPGGDFQCRCDAEPYLDDIFKEIGVKE